jgi:hypothetical protein
MMMVMMDENRVHLEGSGFVNTLLVDHGWKEVLAIDQIVLEG